jgi:CheY-like chemotaxis protein
MLNMLVLSNNAVLQRLMRDLIARWIPESRLLAAADRASALEINANVQPDIVFLEMSMPTRSGLRFVQDMKTANGDGSMLVLFNYPFLQSFDAHIPKGITGYFDIGSDAFVDDIHRCIVYTAERKIFEKSRGSQTRS